VRAPALVALVVVIAAVAASGGFWYGRQRSEPVSPQRQPQTQAHQHAAEPGAPGAAPERKILYYKDPMGKPDYSPVPKKDPMGMDYIPVYADEAGEGGSIVSVSPARVQMLGIRTEAAARRTLVRPVRAAGRVQFSERYLVLFQPNLRDGSKTST
jgi:hypothetical protein